MKRAIPFLFSLVKEGSLVKQILCAMILGVIVAFVWPSFAKDCVILGNFFVSALKAVAPILVFLLVASSIANHQSGTGKTMTSVLVLYAAGTFLAALVAVIASFLFPTHIALVEVKDAVTAPGGIAEVLKNLLFTTLESLLGLLV